MYEEGLQKNGCPISKLEKLGILGDTALGHNSDGTMSLFYKINYDAIEKHLSRKNW